MDNGLWGRLELIRYPQGRRERRDL